MDAITTGKEAIPLQGARFDLAIDGPFKGRLAGRAHGVDYVRVRADGRMELDLHLIIETDDGNRIALSGDGQAAPRPGPGERAEPGVLGGSGSEACKPHQQQ
jgi:Protein of unknown function (DUF3237)